MTIGINNSSLPARPTPGLAPSSTSMFDANLIPGTVTILAFGLVANCVAFVVTNSYTTFYFGKLVITEDLTSSKLYIKKTI